MNTCIRNPKAYLRQAEHNRKVNEIRHDQTRQRRFERAFLSCDWDEDFDQHRIFKEDNASSSLLGKRDFSTLSPAAITSFNLDFEYFEQLLARTDTSLLAIFRAVFSGLSWQDLGIPKRTFNWKLKKLENFLAHLA